MRKLRYEKVIDTQLCPSYTSSARKEVCINSSSETGKESMT